jgi:hypothetical protein
MARIKWEFQVVWETGSTDCQNFLLPIAPGQITHTRNLEEEENHNAIGVPDVPPVSHRIGSAFVLLMPVCSNHMTRLATQILLAAHKTRHVSQATQPESICSNSKNNTSQNLTLVHDNPCHVLAHMKEKKRDYFSRYKSYQCKISIGAYKQGCNGCTFMAKNLLILLGFLLVFALGLWVLLLIMLVCVSFGCLFLSPLCVAYEVLLL